MDSEQQESVAGRAGIPYTLVLGSSFDSISAIFRNNANRYLKPQREAFKKAGDCPVCGKRLGKSELLYASESEHVIAHKKDIVLHTVHKESQADIIKKLWGKERQQSLAELLTRYREYHEVNAVVAIACNWCHWAWDNAAGGLHKFFQLRRKKRGRGGNEYVVYKHYPVFEEEIMLDRMHRSFLTVRDLHKGQVI